MTAQLQIQFGKVYLPRYGKLIEHLHFINEPSRTLCGKKILLGAITVPLAFQAECDHCLDEKRSIEYQRQIELDRLSAWNANAKTWGGGISNYAA